MKIAYLVSEFPKASETFVSREILTLANLGLPVEPFAFRVPSRLELGRLDDATRSLVERTHYVSVRSGPSALLRRCGGVGALFHENSRLQHAVTVKSNSQARLLRAAALARQLELDGVTHLHAHWPYATQVAHLVNKLTGLPFSVSVHAHEVEYDDGHFPAVFESLSFATFCNRAAMGPT